MISCLPLPQVAILYRSAKAAPSSTSSSGTTSTGTETRT